jgi:hypothetical protein
MLSIILYYLCYVLTQSEASLISRSHSNRACVEFFIPVKVSAQNVIYDAPRVDSNIDAVEYALQADTWSTAPAPLRIKKNITIEDTFFIHAQLCTPNDPKAPKKSSFLQIATHGLVFDKRFVLQSYPVSNPPIFHLQPSHIPISTLPYSNPNVSMFQF